MYKHVRLNHRCLEARWDESRSKWIVKLERLCSAEPTTFEDEADVLFTGTGLLNEWKWPDIQGLHKFRGDLLHTANWDDTFDPTVGSGTTVYRALLMIPFQDKRVAVIGAGSSGIQVVPALVSKVKGMDHYVRGKTWISNQLSEDILKSRISDDGSTNFVYTDQEKNHWKENRDEYLEYRKSLEFRLQGAYEITQAGSIRHINARETYEKNMRERLRAKPEIIDHLLPDFPPLCKRLTPGPGYLEALTMAHVNLVLQSISEVDEDAVITVDGVRRPVDAIICATGFETSPAHGFPIYGCDGINLRERYRVRPETYLGLCTDGFPNFFQSLGPNSFQGAGSLLIMMEYTHRYFAEVLRKLAYQNIKTIEPKRKQVQNFTNYCEKYFQSTVYSATCVSWYKTAMPGATTDAKKEARITALWPGSSLHSLRVLQSVRWEDFELQTVDGDDFGWFGNGWTVAEQNIGEDLDALTWYLKSTNCVEDPLTSKKVG